MVRYYRASEASKMLRVTPQTLRKYRREGKIKGYETPGGQHIYKEEELKELIEGPLDQPDNSRVLAFYIRSSDGDNAKMNEQIRLLTEKYGEPDVIYKDKASGLNEKRKGLNRMIEAAKNKDITEVRFTQKDRLTRFGYRYLELFFEDKGITIGPAFDKQDKSLQEELMQDFMSLIASFSGKFYRIRGYEQKKKLLEDANQELDKRKTSKGNVQRHRKDACRIKCRLISSISIRQRNSMAMMFTHHMSCRF